MDSISNQISGEDLLPAEEVTSITGRENEWHPPKKSWVDRIRQFRFVAAWLALAAVGTTTIWSLTWLQPQSDVCLSLMGASYEENLTVDHNVFGWNSVARMSDFSRDEAETNHFRLTQSPIILRNDMQWESDWKCASENTLVVFCSAHGAADENGPYLLTDGADPSEPSCRMRVEGMIERMAELPASKNKLLVLDATHFSANWEYGVLHNDFARAVDNLNDAIQDVPNLVVLCASGIDQLSWPCEARQQTVFGHFFVEALRGAAADVRKDGRIDAEDVFQFTNNEVSNWVRLNLQRNQQPMLLPRGSEGHDRASQIQLALVRRDYQPTPLPDPHEVNAEQIAQIWEAYHSLLDQPEKPFLHSPARWRRYENTILRFEQMLKVGNLHAANRIIEDINSLHQQLEWEQQQSLAADQGNLYVGHSVAGTVADQSWATEIVNQLWAAKEGQHASIWGQVAHDAEAAEVGPLRTQALALLYERAMSDPIHLMPQASELVDIVLDPIEPPPAEINFLKMLTRHLPADAWSELESELIQTALEVRLLAEQTAVLWRPNDYSYSESVFPWVNELIFAADQQRLLGEDLLFAEKTDRVRAFDYLKKARTQYQLANRNGATVRESLALQCRVAYRLPHLSRWIATTSVGASSLKKSRVQAFETLMSEFHELNRDLRTSGEAVADQTEQAETVSLNDLAKQTVVVSNLFSALESNFDQWCGNQVADFNSHSKHDVALALALPFGAPEHRVSLLNKHLALARQHENTRGDQTKSLSSGLTQRQLQQERVESLKQGQIEGRLALAMIGQEAFDTIQQRGSENFEQLKHRVHVFDTEEHWWRSMYVAGKVIQSTLTQLDERSQAAGSDQPDAVGLSFDEAADFNRLLGMAKQALASRSVNLVQRDRRRSNLFEQLARRSWKSHWFGVNNRPFYLEASQRYLQTAASLWPENPGLDSAQKQLSTAGRIALKFPARLDLTTETRLPFQIGLEELDNPSATTGLPILWIADSSDFTLSRPATGQRLIQRMTASGTPSLESCLLESPLVNQGEEVDDLSDQTTFRLTSFKKKPNPKNSIRPLEVVGFFRGQTLSESIEVHVHAVPDTLIVDHPKPQSARLAVKADRSLHGLYGTGAGALAIVLDASGSMGAPVGKQFGPSAKYFEATRALKEVLQGLPDGIQVSVWIFGQATGPQKTVRRAEDTIRRVAAPVIWNTSDPGQIESLVNNISYPNVEPWNESPIVETLLAAKQDLMGQPGFKSVLLLTDGMDNRFEFSVTRNPRPTVAEALTQAFDKSGVTLNVIGFKVESREAAQSRAQFKVVESFASPGRYVEVQDAERLAEALASVLQQRVRYWVDDYANQSRLQTDGQTSSRRKIEAGRSDEGPKWFPENLDAASYALWTNVNSTPFNLFLERGDQLVVELARQKNGLACRRAPFLTGEYGNKPSKVSADWKVAVMENRIVDSEQLSMLVGIEKTPAMNASSVEVIRPFDVWFELNQQGNDRLHQPIVWSVNREFPVPAWRISANEWPQRLRRNGQSVPVNPNLSVWWSPDRPVTPAVRFERGRDYKTLPELVGRRVDVAGDAVVVKELLVEDRMVEVRPGVREIQPCLVVQLDHANDQRYWVRTEGAELDGYEGRAFESTGKYTGIFWPVVPGEVDRVISALEIVSLADLKRQSESRGGYLRLDNIPSPRADDVAFPPLTGFSKQ